VFGLPADVLPRQRSGRGYKLEAEINALIAEIAADAQREGDLRSDVPPRDVVRVLKVAVHTSRPGRPDDRAPPPRRYWSPLETRPDSPIATLPQNT
jgi:hypothetical protein